MVVPFMSEDPTRTFRDRDDEYETDQHQQHPGKLEEIGRRVDEHEPDVAPSVTGSDELGFAKAGAIRDRDLLDAQTFPKGTHDDLRSEFHSRGSKVHGLVSFASERTHSTMSVRDTCLEHESQHAREDRVADRTV